MAEKNSRQERLVAARARALAIVYLTRRPDVDVHEETKEVGLDLIAFIKPGGKSGIRQFGVQIKGGWEGVTAAQAKQTLRPSMQRIQRSGPFPFPVLFFYFTMEDNQGWYTWVSEPAISPDGGVELRVQKEAFCQPLDDHAVDEIMARVNGWYDAYYAQVGSLAASNA